MKKNIYLLKNTIMEKIILQIRAAEGGSDSKLLVGEMVGIYEKTAKVENFSFQILEERMGYASICL
jgi:protein subunit release factor A